MKIVLFTVYTIIIYGVMVNFLGASTDDLLVSIAAFVGAGLLAYWTPTARKKTGLESFFEQNDALIKDYDKKHKQAVKRLLKEGYTQEQIDSQMRGYK